MTISELKSIKSKSGYRITAKSRGWVEIDNGGRKLAIKLSDFTQALKHPNACDILHAAWYL